MKLNKYYANVKESYLFSDIAKRVNAFCSENPGREVIRLGIGDVTRPLCPAAVKALHQAADEQGRSETFHGYGPEQGYTFLKDAIKGYYASRNIAIEQDEIFVSDGAKSDLGNILDLFSRECTVLVPDPVYPVYVDTNIMENRQILYMNATEQNGFLPLPDDSVKADIVYICSPNNPTGAVYNREQLKCWVDYCNKNGAALLFDAAYECFISDSALPRSIYEIEGARSCAIEFCSLSKTAGFTGTRCGYTIVPHQLEADGLNLNKMWLRRQTTKFNGVSYIVQKAAAAVFSEEGMKQILETVDYYKKNAEMISSTMDQMGIWYTGGKHSPYIWLKCPQSCPDSWKFFDLLLHSIGVVGTPGAGFGSNGEGFLRITSFNSHENTAKACELLKTLKF